MNDSEQSLNPHRGAQTLRQQGGGAGRCGGVECTLAHRRTTAAIYERAHLLRKEPTQAEARLWARLRGRKLCGFNFRRQHAIGPYIADFCSPKGRLIIELDGSHHRKQEEYDAERTVFLASKGYCVLRFWNSEVLNNLEGAIAAILNVLPPT